MTATGEVAKADLKTLADGGRPHMNFAQYRMTALGLGRVKMFRPRETGDAKLNLASCHNCELESTWLARSAVSDLVAPTRSPHVWIAAMSGFTPRMFMTRVRL
jgi:hypothetical protein